MRAEDKAEFSALIRDALAFYGQATSPFAMGVWWSACERFELEQVRKAMTAHAMDPEAGRFPPKPADIVRQLHGTNTDRALVAWGRVYAAISDVGSYRSVVFDEPEIHAAVADAGGWQAICAGKVDELPHLQRRFCEAYRAYRARGCVDWPRVLVGYAEAANALRGREPAPPVRIGNAEGCAAVMRGPSAEALAALSAVRRIA